MMRRVSGNQQGFILAAALLAMVVVAAAVGAGHFLANQEYRIGKSMRDYTRAFYAAEGGIQREWATWSIRNRWNMKAGDSIAVGPVSLANGGSFSGVVTRIDNTPQTDTDTERYYLIRMAGNARAAAAGEEVRNVQAMILRVRYFDFCCTGAITVKDTFEQAGNSTINGNNFTPDAWGGQCDSVNTANLPGVQVEDSTTWRESGRTHNTWGNPPVEVDPQLKNESLTEWDEVTFEFFKAKAEKVYAPGAEVTNTAPAVALVNGQLVCDQSILSNWGEPTLSTHPCFNYFPIIYAQGDLSIRSSAYGQGILVVEGSLTLQGGYSFTGIVLVKGHLLTEGTGGKIIGSAIVAGQGLGNSRLAGNSQILYSSCAVTRAKRNAELAKKEPLPMRAWTEALQ